MHIAVHMYSKWMAWQKISFVAVTVIQIKLWTTRGELHITVRYDIEYIICRFMTFVIFVGVFWNSLDRLIYIDSP